MPSNHARTPGRMLAPAALLLFVVAVALVVLGSGGSDEDSGGETTTAGQRTTTTAAGARAARRRRARNTYTVRPGDSLGLIGQKTGVEVERLQELNPSLDPQALVAGQKIKLRE